MRKWISREEEAELPEFESFEDAWEFFEKRYGKDVVLESVEFINEKKCYFCGLIIDWESYNEMVRLFEAGEPVIGMKYLECKQPIQIFEDGSVHIVH